MASWVPEPGVGVGLWTTADKLVYREVTGQGTRPYPRFPGRYHGSDTNLRVDHGVSGTEPERPREVRRRTVNTSFVRRGLGYHRPSTARPRDKSTTDD